MTEFTHGKILPRDVNNEMKQSYVDYAMSVIVGRALPDVRDGLKPVHRRILYAMNDLGLNPGRAYKKSARVVGETLGKYHPHGEVALYDAMVRMAQDFSFRYTLVDGHGNFGSIDGDSAAAMRYTEVRLDKLASLMLEDIEKETVEFTPNFDESLQEPVYLPSRFPNLLVNGSSGIAVGMATNIPPHNLGETIDAVVALMENPDLDAEALMQHVKGPDFPTAGIILGRDGINKAYKTGRGSITVRGEVRIESANSGKQSLIITELPYMVNKARMIEKIAELVREKKLEGITDLRDETDRTGIRVVIELRKDVNPHVMLNKLYKNTQLQQSFGIIMLALVKNQPKIMPLKEILWHYLEHQRDIIRRRTRFELRKAQERLHILEGFRVALDDLDRIIVTIRRSKDGDEAKENLVANFPLSIIQAQAILDMRLQRLTALERSKIEDEHSSLSLRVKRLQEILADTHLVDQVIRTEMLAIKEKYSDFRRTRIVHADGDLDIEDLIADEDMVITITHQGYIKRLPVTTYRSQLRGGKGITALNRRDDDFVEHMFITSTHQQLLFFTNQGQVYKKKVYEVPQASRQARGTAIINLIQLRSQETISAVIPIREFRDDLYLIMSTRRGYVKKTQLSHYGTNLKSGLIGIKLDPGDELIGVQLTNGSQQLMLVTAKGQAIRFEETQIRTMGRVARGVRGIRLSGDDGLVDMVNLKENSQLLVVTERGFGKRTRVEDFRITARGGKGIKAISITAKNGPVVVARMATPGDDMMIVTARGILIRQKVDGVSIIGRSTQGMTLIKLDTDDKVVAVARVVREPEE